MTMIIWPVDLPQELITQGLAEALPDNTLRTKTETGPTRDRRRTTSGRRNVKGTLMIDQTLVSILEEFYFTTTKDGTIEFLWTLPLSGSSAMFKFSGPPEYTSRSGALINVALKFTARKL